MQDQAQSVKVGANGALGKPMGDVLHVYLPEPMCRDAVAGRVNILNRITAAVAQDGWRTVYHTDDADQIAKAANRKGRALFHMIEPPVAGGLTLRRAYHYPFWQIEATTERWRFDVATAAFVASEIDPDKAKTFSERLQRRVFEDTSTSEAGYIFMPLQGRVSLHRSFQSMSPLAMIEATLAAAPTQDIRATLHPKELYDASDLARLSALEAAHPRFQLVRADANDLLRACDHVVTQNSAIAMNGYLLHKPAVLFAGIDFHHIAGSVPRDGMAQAFASIAGPTPDFDAYLYWFFQHNTINAGAPGAEDQIRARLLRHGWLT